MFKKDLAANYLLMEYLKLNQSFLHLGASATGSSNLRRRKLHNANKSKTRPMIFDNEMGKQFLDGACSKCTVVIPTTRVIRPSGWRSHRTAAHDEADFHVFTDIPNRHRSHDTGPQKHDSDLSLSIARSPKRQKDRR